MENKQVWCDKCDDYAIPKLKVWESSKAIIKDFECSKCGEILTRIPRTVIQKSVESKDLKTKQECVEFAKLVVAHIWQFAKADGYPLTWHIEDDMLQKVRKHYGLGAHN